MGSVGAWMWFLPIVIVAVAVFVMIKEVLPDSCMSEAAEGEGTTLATTMLGIAALVYAVVEIVFSVVFYNIKRKYDKTQAQVHRAPIDGKDGVETAVVVP